jgi:hypothetical protein
MAKVDPIPPTDELEKRREPRYILNPKDVAVKGEQRIRQWAGEKMSKNEHKFNDRWTNGQIVASGIVEPEEIDIGAIYPFPDLWWLIHRDGKFWTFVLLSKKRMLFKIQYAKI